MIGIDAVRISARNLAEGRVFFIANVIAIAVGVFLVVIMLSLANGIRDYAEQLLKRDVGATTIEVTFDRRVPGTAQLTALRLNAFRGIQGVAAVTPVVQGVFAELRAAGPEALISLWSTTGTNDPEIARYAYSAGTLAKLTARSIVINEAVAAEMRIFPAAKAVGRSVKLRLTRAGVNGRGEALEMSFVVAAVARQTRFSRCYVPLATMESIWSWQNRTQQGTAFVYDSALVYARNVADVPAARADLEKRGYRTASILDTVQRYREATRLLSVVLGSLGGIALLTGSVSIFNAAWASVLRRVREFAVYKSYGATRASIMSIVLLEAAMTAAVAAAVGFAGAWASATFLRRLTASEFDFNLFPFNGWLLLIALVIAMAACIGASVIPAWRAARLSVGEALRSM